MDTPEADRKQKRLRIVFTIERLEAAHGGAESYAWNLGAWLVAQGHELLVLTQEPAQPLPGAEVRRIEVGGGSVGKQLRFGKRLQAALARVSRDVVHGFNHTWPADIIMLHGGVHLAFEASNALSAPTVGSRLFKTLAQRMGRKYAALRINERKQFEGHRTLYACVSQRVADDIARWYPSAAPRCRVIPPGVDTATFRPDPTGDRRRAVRHALGLNNEQAVLLFVAHNFRLKGLHDILRALPRVRPAVNAGPTLLVVGRGSPRTFGPRLRRSGLADSVRFLGARRDLPDLYHAADALVHPTYYDTFGGVVLEAAACGLPVVVSRQAGVAQLFTDGHGARIIDQPCRPENLADAVVDVLHPKQRSVARRAGPSLAARYPVDAAFRAVEDLYREVSA